VYAFREKLFVCVAFVKQELNFSLLLVCEVDLLIGEVYSLIGEGSNIIW